MDSSIKWRPKDNRNDTFNFLSLRTFSCKIKFPSFLIKLLSLDRHKISSSQRSNCLVCNQGDGDERASSGRQPTTRKRMHIEKKNITKYLPIDKKRNNFRIGFIFSGVENWMPYRPDDNQLVADCIVHTMNLSPSATFFLSLVGSVHVSFLLFFFLQHNIWITIGNIGVCVECVCVCGVCRSEDNCRCMHSRAKVVSDARKMQCAILHFSPMPPCEAIVCAEQINIYGQIVTADSCSTTNRRDLKGTTVSKAKCVYVCGDVGGGGGDIDAKHRAPRIIVYPIHCSRPHFTSRASQSERWKRMTHRVDFPCGKNQFTLTLSWSENIVLKQN